MSRNWDCARSQTVFPFSQILWNQEVLQPPTLRDVGSLSGGFLAEAFQETVGATVVLGECKTDEGREWEAPDQTCGSECSLAWGLDILVWVTLSQLL